MQEDTVSEDFSKRGPVHCGKKERIQIRCGKIAVKGGLGRMDRGRS